MKHAPIVVRSLPFGAYIALLALAPILEGLLPETLDARWIYGVQVGLVALLLAAFWSRYDELTGASVPGPGDVSLAVGVGLVVFVLWINLDFAPFVIGTAGDGFDPREGGVVRWDLALTRLAGAALVVPVMEELFWRSFILRWLEKADFLRVAPASVGLKALLIGSGVFALEHHLWLAGLLAGLAYGWLYIRTGNLWVPILAHAVTNGLLGAWVLRTGAWGFW